MKMNEFQFDSGPGRAREMIQAKRKRMWKMRILKKILAAAVQRPNYVICDRYSNLSMTSHIHSPISGNVLALPRTTNASL